jgi:hypothetical protein
MVRVSGVAIVVFSDLVDSTALLARRGDDRMDQVRRAHVGDVSREVAAGGGRVVKTLGDGVMASFESALGALRASAAIQAAVGGWTPSTVESESPQGSEWRRVSRFDGDFDLPRSDGVGGRSLC